MSSKLLRSVACFVLTSFFVLSPTAGEALAQGQAVETGIVSNSTVQRASRLTAWPGAASSGAFPATSKGHLYFDSAHGSSSSDLVRRALASNPELGAVRMEIERARARLQQTGLRPNPTIDFEQTTGRWTGSNGERETSIGLAVPLDIGGQRKKRIDLARAELEATEAEVADRERRLAAEVRNAYAEAIAAIRELEITETLNNLDAQTARIVEARVTEGESAPLESNLLRVEVDRLRARRALVEGRLQAAMFRLKTLSGIPLNESLLLAEDLNSPSVFVPPSSMDAALDDALRTRPDLRLARLTEEVAQAGFRLARAQAIPDVTAFSKYTMGRSVFDSTPVGVLNDRDKLLSFGVSISIPLFNRGQGAKAEALAAIAQSRKRREFLESVVRSEVAAAYARYDAALLAMSTLQSGVLARSAENIRSIRGAYEIGAFKVTDLLVEQRRYVDSQREFIEAMAERYRARADLQSAIGATVKPLAKQIDN